ncbi:hypothetical protein ATP_00477 [Candidatus Phytoplasma mali]|uniref:Uncharacterized protein n=1 Tax=Phytoplasma mali (strain AT) TaxID=482235 RepID=B3R044_PHYMT|nr:hypothetical protein [Candidatus Phytoplasma mali]CAP18208.1 hypothetical protein ATP_00021 [Candidatus Phytoplasma mali]CAP18664.1 hypothetical protein ATP_00477 [Candidatus Phytoplasma mali]
MTLFKIFLKKKIFLFFLMFLFLMLYITINGVQQPAHKRETKYQLSVKLPSKLPSPSIKLLYKKDKEEHTIDNPTIQQVVDVVWEDKLSVCKVYTDTKRFVNGRIDLVKKWKDNDDNILQIEEMDSENSSSFKKAYRTNEKDSYNKILEFIIYQNLDSKEDYKSPTKTIEFTPIQPRTHHYLESKFFDFKQF